VRPVRNDHATTKLAFLGSSLGLHAAVVLVAVVAGRPGPLADAPTPENRGEARGDTFEVPTTRDIDGLETVGPSSPNPGSQTAAPAEPATSPDTTAEPDEGGDHPAHVTTPRSARPHTPVTARARHNDESTTPGGDDTPAANALFGAVGERSAAPLAATFARGFPQAASADPLWLSAPFGPAGSVDVDLTLDEEGALVDTRTSGNPGPALAEGIRRTLALIRARSFVAARRVTRLRVTASVTADQVHDGLHGEVFAIGGSFEAGEGSGFFALAVGRRIDIRVRILR